MQSMTRALDLLHPAPILNQAHPVFVLVGSARAPVTSIVADPSRFGSAIRCFLSPFDAVMELLFLRRRGDKTVEAVRRSNFLARDFFYSRTFRQRPLSVHIAWLAHDHRLVARPDGFLARIACDQDARWRVRIRASDELVVSARTWSTLDRLHEDAGLFAWRDTLQLVRGWLVTPAEAEAVLERAFSALAAVEPIVIPVDEATQLALYDPEAGCWHFVPRTVLVQNASACQRD